MRDTVLGVLAFDPAFDERGAWIYDCDGAWYCVGRGIYVRVSFAPYGIGPLARFRAMLRGRP